MNPFRLPNAPPAKSIAALPRPFFLTDDPADLAPLIAIPVGVIPKRFDIKLSFSSLLCLILKSISPPSSYCGTNPPALIAGAESLAISKFGFSF